MNATIALFRNEFRLLLRNPAVVIWTVLIPIAAVVVMCLIPGARQPVPLMGGLSVIEAYQPTLVVFATTMLLRLRVPPPLACRVPAFVTALCKFSVCPLMFASTVPPLRLLSSTSIVPCPSMVWALVSVSVPGALA